MNQFDCVMATVDYKDKRYRGPGELPNGTRTYFQTYIIYNTHKDKWIKMTASNGMTLYLDDLKDIEPIEKEIYYKACQDFQDEDE